MLLNFSLEFGDFLLEISGLVLGFLTIMHCLGMVAFHCLHDGFRFLGDGLLLLDFLDDFSLQGLLERFVLLKSGIDVGKFGLKIILVALDLVEVDTDDLHSVLATCRESHNVIPVFDEDSAVLHSHLLLFNGDVLVLDSGPEDSPATHLLCAFVRWTHLGVREILVENDTVSGNNFQLFSIENHVGSKILMLGNIDMSDPLVRGSSLS